VAEHEARELLERVPAMISLRTVGGHCIYKPMYSQLHRCWTGGITRSGLAEIYPS
jgi:hypothetical protein